MPKQHTVVQGESIISIAEVHGFFAETLWDHPANAALRELRQYRNVLAPGDVVTIPDKVEKSLPVTTGRSHVFRRRGVPALLRLRLLDEEQPRAGLVYRLVVGGREQRGVTDDDGVLEKYVPTSAREGVLLLGDDDDEVIQLKLGELDPVSEISGIQARLNNLGFACGELSGELDDATREALRDLQRRFDLAVTGEPDPATRARLFALHDDQAPIEAQS